MALCLDPKYNKYYKKLQIDLIEYVDCYDTVYKLFCDKKSQRIFKDILLWRLERQPAYLVDAYFLSGKVQYVASFLKLTNQEVFVDYGTFNGDSYKAFVDNTKQIKRAYLYEADNKKLN